MGGVQSSGKQPIDQDKLSEFQMAFKRKDINAIQKILGNESLDFSLNVEGEEYNLLEYVITHSPPMDIVKRRISKIKEASEEQESISIYNEYLNLIEKIPSLSEDYYFKTLEILYEKVWGESIARMAAGEDISDLKYFNFDISKHVDEIVLDHMVSWFRKNGIENLPQELDEAIRYYKNINQRTTVEKSKSTRPDTTIKTTKNPRESAPDIGDEIPEPLARNYPLHEAGGGNKKKSNKRIKRKKTNKKKKSNKRSKRKSKRKNNKR
tara:strand:- start:1424 stop:2221 length:798 start_codon:yes stop_codon:yes gene_type:complete